MAYIPPIPPKSGQTRKPFRPEPNKPTDNFGFFKGLVIALILGIVMWFCILCPFFVDLL